jgi:LPS sulfotransferase NodH
MPPRKAIILTSQRSGSTFLASCLDAHPQIRCYGEVLNGSSYMPPKVLLNYKYPTKAYRYIAAGGWNPVAILKTYFRSTVAPVIVVQAMYNRIDKRSVRRYLQENTDIRIIHLRRDNLLKQYVSKALLSRKRGTKERPWQPHVAKPVPPVSIYISPQKAIEAMRQVSAYFDEFEGFLSKHRKIELVYEQMINGQQLTVGAWSALSELLEVEPAENVSSVLVKMNPSDLRPMVENYEEVAEALKGTEFERFLD